MLQNVLKVTSLHYSWSNSPCCSYIHWHSHVAEWHLYLYIPKAMVYLCNSGFRDFTPCLQQLWKRKDLCTCWRISSVSYRSCMMAEVSMRYCCYCIFESVWAAILDSFPPENLCLVRNAASHLSLSLRECRCCRKWVPFVCMQWQTPNVKHHDPFGYLNARVSVGCCLATK